MSKEEVENAIELLPNMFFYVAVTRLPVDDNERHFFCTDEVFRYCNYFLDFGPLNISQIHRFCTVVDLFVIVGMLNPQLKINSVLMAACYLVIVRGMTVDNAWERFKDLPLPYYHDASADECDFPLTVKHCIEGLQLAVSKGVINWHDFDTASYDHYERVENGDFNWVVSDRIMAFSSPHTFSKEINGIFTMTPEDYINVFSKLNVGVVIRLNRPSYESSRFHNKGIKHYDIYFPDGGLPEYIQLLRFIAIIKTHRCAVAVHCKAGLGRTGTVICAYLMYEYKMTAEQAIGYCRICRPGSVVGCQQHFLKRMEMQLQQCGDEEIMASLKQKRSRLYDIPSRRGSPSPSPVYRSRPSSSLSWITASSSSSSSSSSSATTTTTTSTPSTNKTLPDQGSSLYSRKVENTTPAVQAVQTGDHADDKAEDKVDDKAEDMAGDHIVRNKGEERGKVNEEKKKRALNEEGEKQIFGGDIDSKQVMVSILFCLLVLMSIASILGW